MNVTNYGKGSCWIDIQGAARPTPSNHHHHQKKKRTNIYKIWIMMNNSGGAKNNIKKKQKFCGDVLPSVIVVVSLKKAL